MPAAGTSPWSSTQRRSSSATSRESGHRQRPSGVDQQGEGGDHPVRLCRARARVARAIRAVNTASQCRRTPRRPRHCWCGARRRPTHPDRRKACPSPHALGLGSTPAARRRPASAPAVRGAAPPPSRQRLLAGSSADEPGSEPARCRTDARVGCPPAGRRSRRLRPRVETERTADDEQIGVPGGTWSGGCGSRCPSRVRPAAAPRTNISPSAARSAAPARPPRGSGWASSRSAVSIVSSPDPG